MSNHGAIVHGADLDVAVQQSSLLEWACSLYWRAASVGTPRVLGQDEQLEFVKVLTERGYGNTHRSEP